MDNLPAPASSAALMPWSTVVETFLASAVDSNETRRAYRRALTDALTYLRVETLAELTGTSLATYRAHVMSLPLSASAQKQALAALRSLLKWSRPLGAHRLIADTWQETLRTPKAKVVTHYNTVTDSEISRLLSTAQTPRDKALLVVMVGCGLRVGEAVALDVPDIIHDEDGTVIDVRNGKGRKDRLIPVPDDVAAVLWEHIDGRRTGPLFRAHDRGASKRRRQRMTDRAAALVVARVLRAAGVNGRRLSPHSLRHTFAIRALRAGANVVAVSKLLGHSQVATTQRYVDHLALSELRAAVPPLPVVTTTTG